MSPSFQDADFATVTQHGRAVADADQFGDAMRDDQHRRSSLLEARAFWRITARSNRDRAPRRIRRGSGPCGLRSSARPMVIHCLILSGSTPTSPWTSSGAPVSSAISAAAARTLAVEDIDREHNPSAPMNRLSTTEHSSATSTSWKTVPCRDRGPRAASPEHARGPSPGRNRRQHARDNLGQRALAAAIAADDGMDFAKIGAEIAAVERPRHAEELLQADVADGGISADRRQMDSAGGAARAPRLRDSTDILGRDPRSQAQANVDAQGLYASGSAGWRKNLSRKAGSPPHLLSPTDSQPSLSMLQLAGSTFSMSA